MKYEIVKTCNCEDSKTAFVRPQPALQPGDVVEGEPMQNLYGTFLSVRNAKGRHYYIKPEFAKALLKQAKKGGK